MWQTDPQATLEAGESIFCPQKACRMGFKPCADARGQEQVPGVGDWLGLGTATADVGVARGTYRAMVHEWGMHNH